MSSIRLHVNVADDKNLNITVFYWIIHYNVNWTEKPQVFSPNRQLCHQVMVEVQHLQFAALTQPLGDTFQHVPLIKQRQLFVSAKQTHSV